MNLKDYLVAKNNPVCIQYRKLSESDYRITLLAGFAENDISAEVKDGIL